MEHILIDHIEKAMQLCLSAKGHQDRIMEAKEAFIKLTGALDDSKDEYESRMQSFNEWFLFDYIPDTESGPFIIDYLKKSKDLDEEIRTSLTNVHYSLFEYGKKSFSKKIVLKDIVKDEKHILEPENFSVALLPSEIFAGRVVSFKNESYLLPGIRFIPKEVKPLIIKKAKTIKKLGNPSEERKFVLEVERLKTKWLQYGHMKPEQIFIFN